MWLEFFIGLRYLFSGRKKNRLLSIMTFFTVFGVFLGVFIPIVTMSVMGGIQNEIKEKILGLKGHIILVPPVFEQMEADESFLNELRKVDGVISATPIIEAQSLVQLFEEYEPILIRGVPNTIFNEDPVFKKIYQVVEGDASLERTYFSHAGIELARINFLSVGERIKLITPKKLNQLQSGQTSFDLYLSGFFKTGFLEYDEGVIFTSLRTLQKFYDMPGQATQIEIKVDNAWEVDQIANELESQFPGRFRLFTWKDINQNFFKAIALEKVGLWTVLTIILVVAVFNVMSGQIMTVIDKRREIGILKTLGLGPRRIASIFLIEGLITTAIGAGLGALCGVLFSMNLISIIGLLESTLTSLKVTMATIFNTFSPRMIHPHPVEIIPEGIYYIDGIPVELSFGLVFTILVCAFIFSVVAGMIPSYQAAKLSPMEVIRHE